MTPIKSLPVAAALALLASCGAGEPAAAPAEPAAEASQAAETAPAAEPAAAATAASAGAFNWDKWAGIVNEDPCGWLPAEDLAALGITGTGAVETTSTETRCLWTEADGTRVFSAGVQSWDGADNLVGEREGQIKLAADMGGFIKIGEGAGTVTAIYRKSRGSLVMFPNSDDESVIVLVNAQKTMRDDEATKEAKDARAIAYAEKLMAAYGL